MENKRKLIAEKIVNRHIIWAMAAGVIPIPLVDTISLIFIQTDMLKQLCKIYDIDFDENLGKNIVMSIIASSTASGIAVLFRKEKVLSRVTMTILSGAFTYAIGRIFMSNFEHGVKSIIDIDLKAGEELFDEEFERGQQNLG